jgi:hypothetical protein
LKKHHLHMEWAQLVLDYLRVLLWPALILFVVFAFRAELAGLIKRIKAARLPGGAEFELFEEEAAAVLDLARTKPESSNGSIGQADPPARPQFAPIRQWAYFDPKRAVAGAWRRLDSFILEEAARHGVSKADRIEALEQLSSKLAIPPNTVAAAARLQELYSSLMRGESEVASDGALAFIDACEEIVNEIDAARNRS